uniref:Nucleolar protein 6 n=1 Tax=Leersia perrieri TaxID=77586 RepID=A0A0D9XX83_9ORYZ
MAAAAATAAAAAAAAAAADHSIDYKLSALLQEVRPSAAALRAAGEAADAVAGLIRKVPTQQANPEDVSAFVRDLGLAGEKLAFTFRPPEVVRVAGSHAAGAVARPDVSADLLVRLPKECFHEKDFLNHRYHAKRCLYLYVIEKSLRSSPSIQKISWSTFLDEARKPVLHVYPATEIAELPGFYVRIIPTASSLFNVSKLNLSTRNNVRAYTKDGINLPTPKYNCSILEDIFLEENAEFINSSVADWKTLQEALVLVWARQRTSIYAHDCLNGYLISAILVFLTVDSGGNLINRSMTTRQIFRVVMKFLATSKVWMKGLVIQPNKKRTITKEDIACFLKIFDVVICDVSGHVNLAFRMTKSAFIELQDEAACALNCLDKCRDGGFEELFMAKVDLCAKFDSCLRINLKGNSKIVTSSLCLDDLSWRELEKNVQSLLQQGLTDRTKMIRVLWRSTPSEWNITDGFSEFGSSPLLVGIMLSSLEKSFRLVDIGPNPENRDEKEDLIHVVDQLDFCLLVGGQDPVSSSGALFEAYDTFAKQLRLLDDVPLKISTVQPLDPAFRHTSVFPPEPHPLAYEKRSSQRLPNFTATCIQSLEDRGMFVTASEDEVNVLTSGYSFLLKIFHERGLVLQKRAGDDKTQTVPSEDKELFLRSQHSSMINGLHGRYQVYGPVVSFDWTFSPMIIDINSDFNLKDEKEINDNFMLSRKSYEQNPHDIEPAMFLATSYDKASEAWTKHSPSKPVLKRMASYAKSSAELLTNLILHGQSGQYTWELVIRGKPSKDFHPYMALNKGIVKSLHDARDKLLVNFDPTTCFLRDLKCAFPKSLKLWYDSIGGDAVGLTWEHSKKRGRDESDETMLEPASILKEVGNVGKGSMILGQREYELHSFSVPNTNCNAEIYVQYNTDNQKAVVNIGDLFWSDELIKKTSMPLTAPTLSVLSIVEDDVVFLYLDEIKVADSVVQTWNSRELFSIFEFHADGIGIPLRLPARIIASYFSSYLNRQGAQLASNK